MKLPQYINCQEPEVVECNYFLKAGCPQTCAYSDEVNDMWVGSIRFPPGDLELDIEKIEGEFE